MSLITPHFNHPPSCPICRSAGGRPLWDFCPPDLGRDFKLLECLKCSSVYVHPRPVPEKMAAYFSNEALFQCSTDPEGRARSLILERDLKRREFSGYGRRIRPLVPRGRVLDVGCGLGLFLELLGDGYDRVGVDVNGFAGGFVRERLGIDVLVGDALAVDFQANAFDLIALMQTWDHLAAPGVFMERAARWLRPGGVLFLSSLINIRSPMARIFREKFRLLHPFHVVYFSPAMIRKYLAALGFRVLRLDFPYFSTPYFNVADLPGTGLSVARRLWGHGDRAGYSPPFIGNTMNIYAVKEA